MQRPERHVSTAPQCDLVEADAIDERMDSQTTHETIERQIGRVLEARKVKASRAEPFSILKDKMTNSIHFQFIFVLHICSQLSTEAKTCSSDLSSRRWPAEITLVQLTTCLSVRSTLRSIVTSPSISCQGLTFLHFRKKTLKLHQVS